MNYKSRLENILADILLITQVAEVASEADVIAQMTAEAHTSINEAVAEKKRKGMLSGVKWKSLKEFGPTKTNSQDRSDSDLDMVSSGTISVEAVGDSHLEVKSEEDEGQRDDLTDSDGSEDGSDSDNDSENDPDESNDADSSVADNGVDESTKRQSGTGRSTASAYVSTSKIKSLLDRWEEPISKNDKVSADKWSNIYNIHCID